MSNTTPESFRLDITQADSTIGGVKVVEGKIGGAIQFYAPADREPVFWDLRNGENNLMGTKPEDWKHIAVCLLYAILNGRPTGHSLWDDTPTAGASQEQLNAAWQAGVLVARNHDSAWLSSLHYPDGVAAAGLL